MSGTIEGATTKNKRNVDCVPKIWVRQKMAAYRDRPGMDMVLNRSTRLVALKNNAVVKQQINAPEDKLRVKSVFLRRYIGDGTVRLTLNGSTWREVPPLTSTWLWVDIPAQEGPNPVIGIRLDKAGDQIGVDFALIEDGVHKTSPMEVLHTPVTETPTG